MKCPKCRNKEMILTKYETMDMAGIPEKLVKFMKNKKTKYYSCINCCSQYILVFPSGQQFLWDTDVKPLRWESLDEKVVFT